MGFVKRVATAAVSIVFASTQAVGSGDPTPRPVYVFADPQNADELAAMAGGRLGIVKGKTTDALLYLNWRRLSGLDVHAETAAALNTPCCGSGTQGQTVWLEAHRQIPGVDQQYWIVPERDGPNYVSIPTCFDDAFETAATTLRDRARRYGTASPDVRAWVEAQDAVFAACSKPVAALPALSPTAPAWLRADHAYQEAALALYNSHAEDAARRFAEIAGDRASPWRPLGLYLSARALEHAAIDAPDAARFAAAHAAVDRLTAAPAGTYGQGELTRMRQVLEFHEHPAALLARLDRQLNARAPISDIAVALRDYMTLADAQQNRPEAADWIRTIQAKNRTAGLAHAIERWRAGGRTRWLVAALTLADPRDPASGDLSAASDRVAVTDPAWVTARYHRIRLTIDRANPASIRVLADAVLGKRDLAKSDRNIFVAIRAQTAPSLADFVGDALRDPYCVPGAVLCADRGSPAGDGLIGRLPSGRFVGLGPDARVVIDRLPLAERLALVDDPRLPDAIRLDIALTDYVRAVQLQDDAAIDRCARRLTALLPQVRDDWRRITATPPGTAKRFAEIFVMTKIPSLRVDLADYARPIGTVRQFAGYWADLRLPPRGRNLPDVLFASPALYRPQGWFDGGDGPDASSERADLACLDKCGAGTFAFHEPPFIVPLLARAVRERRSFVVTKLSYDQVDHPANAVLPGSTSIWTMALAFVTANPNDPRAPETLYRLIRVSRWGANPDHLGRQAFQLLHRRYPRSPWTARSPYYYD